MARSRALLRGFDVRREFLQAGFEPAPFFFELDFLGGELFQPYDVALLLQVERGDFVAELRQLLREGKRVGLGLAQGFLLAAQLSLPCIPALAPRLQRPAMPVEGGIRRAQAYR